MTSWEAVKKYFSLKTGTILLIIGYEISVMKIKINNYFPIRF